MYFLVCIGEAVTHKLRMATEGESQIESEAKKDVRGVIESIAKEKCPQDFHIDRDDLNTFSDSVKVVCAQCLDESSLITGVLDEDNGSASPYQFPGHPTHTRSESHHDHIGVDGNLSLNPRVVPVVRAAGRGHVRVDNHRQQSYREEPCPIPANTKMEHRTRHFIHCHRVHLRILQSCSVRVYCAKPVKIGAAAGGGAGAAIGTVGGAAGGAVVGAVIGSVVPVAGTIVGGVIGGVVGGVGGLVTGGAAAAGAGAGIGAAHSNCTYKTIKAVEVFKKLDDFSREGKYYLCTVVVNTNCPYQGHKLRRKEESD